MSQTAPAFGLEWESVRFIEHPACFRGRGGLLGVRKIERQGRLLQTTGPERTLVEGFYRLSLAGGAEELVRSASRALQCSIWTFSKRC